jgi:hypothetical protein
MQKSAEKIIARPGKRIESWKKKLFREAYIFYKSKEIFLLIARILSCITRIQGAIARIHPPIAQNISFYLSATEISAKSSASP